MNQANGQVERDLRICKRKILNNITLIESYFIKDNPILSDQDIQQLLYDCFLLLDYKTASWIPYKYLKLYLFLLSTIDPLGVFRALSQKTKFKANSHHFNTLLKPIKTNLLQTRGADIHGFFGGVVHKNDVIKSVYESYFPSTLIAIYSDGKCLRSNQEYIDLFARDIRLRNRLEVAEKTQWRSATFANKVQSMRNQYNQIKLMDWKPIHDRCLLWEPLPHKYYLNPLQTTQLKSLGKL